MTHYTATITHFKNEPIGIGLANDPNYGLVITSIAPAPEGALGESCLKKGMKLLTINNIDVSGLPSKEVVKILKDVEGKLVLSAQNVVPADITFEADKHYRLPDGVIVHGTMKNDINSATPTIFKEAGVPSTTYSRIYKLIERDMKPPAAALRIHEITLDKEFGSYVATQMVTGGMVGFGTESSNEKKFYEMVLKSAHLERNVDLKAMEVMMQVNAMLAKYNLMATVALEARKNGKESRLARKKYETLNVVGLKFHQIE